MGNYKKKGYRQQRVCECGEKFLGTVKSIKCYDCKEKERIRRRVKRAT